jgi:hypothetical protein
MAFVERVGAISTSGCSASCAFRLESQVRTQSPQTTLQHMHTATC